jgi:hypothetical protein
VLAHEWGAVAVDAAVAVSRERSNTASQKETLELFYIAMGRGHTQLLSPQPVDLLPPPIAQSMCRSWFKLPSDRFKLLGLIFTAHWLDLHNSTLDLH